MDLKRERAPRTYEKVEEQLTELIVKGGLKPGDQLLPERDLAAKLGVSRPSVRMALSALASRGMVTITPRGSFVALTNISDALRPVVAAMLSQRQVLLEFTEFRKVLEVGAARLAAVHGLPEELRELEQNIDEMEMAVREGRSPAEPDLKFHVGLGKASHNLFVNQMMTLLSGAVADEAYGPILEAVYAPPGESAAWVARSREILAAVRSGDPERAAREMISYLDRVETIVRAYFAGRVS